VAEKSRRRRVGWSFRECSVGGGHDAFRLSPPVLDARGTRRRATPRRWRERAAARAPLPRAALGVKASPRPSRRGIHRRPKTYCSGWCAFLNRLFARVNPPGRTVSRSREAFAPTSRTRTPLVAHTRRVDDEPRANANLLTDWAQPNGWELTRIDFVILALTRTRRFFFALRARPKCGRDGGCGIR
jgi:hypothetical protein